MKTLQKYCSAIAFFLVVNGFAQQSDSKTETIGNSEITTQKKANPQLEKAEQKNTLNTPTWEKTKNPNSKETNSIPKEENYITNERSKKPE